MFIKMLETKIHKLVHIRFEESEIHDQVKNTISEKRKKKDLILPLLYREYIEQ